MLLYGDRDYADDLDGYVSAIGLREFIYSDPEGFLRVLDERCDNLSGGEKQKIAVVRALLKNPDVLVFDEPTSAIDSMGKNAFISMIDKLKERRIIILVSHDERVLDACDEVISLDSRARASGEKQPCRQS